MLSDLLSRLIKTYFYFRFRKIWKLLITLEIATNMNSVMYQIKYANGHSQNQIMSTLQGKNECKKLENDLHESLQFSENQSKLVDINLLSI